jgi:hypothetical protein
MKCGEKWRGGHQCPKQVPLHILEEVWDVMNLEEDLSKPSDNNSNSSDEEVLALSVEAMQGVQGKKTMRLQGRITNTEILILVDSGSTSTFISTAMANKLSYQQQEVLEVYVQVASGDKLSSTKAINNLTWWTQGHTFSTIARTLDIPCYDLILEMDWMEQFSPMWVDWCKKKMRFNHKGHQIQLNGVKDCTDKCLKLKSKKLNGLLRKGRVAQMVQLSMITDIESETNIPDPMQKLVLENEDLFKVPTEMPPPRTLDHHIPPVLRVKPVNMNPYRYTSTQKDEIERQVKEMLSNGVIQPSMPLLLPSTASEEKGRLMTVLHRLHAFKFYYYQEQISAPYCG